MENYIDINRKAWNEKTDIHIKSDFYDNESFLKGNTTLKSIELGMFGDAKGKTILHLQCHFGQDSISLARLGAEVTGVDLSDNAIENARKFAEQTNTDVEFICCDIFDLPNYLDKQFDIVFTSYGVIGWLPDLDKWAKIVSQYLKPGGRFVFVEFHPFVWMYDDNFEKIIYNYFNAEAIVENVEGTYTDRDAAIKNETVTWNHSTSEVLNSLINNGIEIKSFNEFDYSPYDCFSHTVKIDTDKYRIKHLGNKIPMIFSLEGIKK
jgi:2-polyprenyl-3-methyl-5-hydroxy-6-metoxy-1,4-benzoquinol methylase